MSRRSPWKPIFPKDLKYGNQLSPGSILGVLNGTASPGAIAVSVSLPAVTATGSVLTVIGSVTDALLDRVQFIIIDDANDDVYLTSPPNDRLIKCDISTPSAPTVTGSRSSSTTLDNAMGLAKSGNYVHVAANLDNCLTSNDITGANPAFGDNVVSVTDLQAPTDVGISGTTAFVLASIASADDKLTAVDITDPLNLALVSGGVLQSSLFNLVTRILVDPVDQLAYVLSDSTADTLSIVDISNPASMSIVGSLTDASLGGLEGQMVKDGDVLYVTRSGVTSIDVSTPATPAILDATAVSGSSGICKIGDMLFIARGTSDAISVVNASDPANLSAIIYTLTDSTNLAGVQQLATDGTYIYAAVFTADRLTVLQYA